MTEPEKVFFLRLFLPHRRFVTEFLLVSRLKFPVVDRFSILLYSRSLKPYACLICRETNQHFMDQMDQIDQMDDFIFLITQKVHWQSFSIPSFDFNRFSANFCHKPSKNPFFQGQQNIFRNTWHLTRPWRCIEIDILAFFYFEDKDHTHLFLLFHLSYLHQN